MEAKTVKIDFWYTLEYGADGRTIFGFREYPEYLRPSQKRGFTLYQGKHINLWVRSNESAIEQRKMALAWGKGLLDKHIVKVNLNED